MGAFYSYVVFCISIFFVGTQVNGNDPCKIYQKIHDPHRSTKSKLKPGIRANCDFRQREGWYRFTSIVGGEIPRTKPEPFHCSTIAPIWMKGDLPTINKPQVDALACINLFNIKNGCAQNLPMSVKYCDINGEVFYVYKLSPPRGCAKAYCAGDKTPCPRGMTGIKPNCNVSQVVEFPYSLVPRPKVNFIKNRQPLAMGCKFDFPGSWKNVTYFVEWFANGKSIRNYWMCEEGKDCDETTFESVISYGEFYMGQNLQCRLKMKYKTSPDNKWSTAKYSNIFYPGIEVTPRQVVVVKECERSNDVKVNLRPTVPIHQNDQISDGSGFLNVSILVPQQYRDQRKHVAVDTCSVQLKTEDITSGKNITIKGICDNLDEKAASQGLKFNFVYDNILPPWGGYRPPALVVRVNTTETSICSSTTDPHYTTFDGKHFTFFKTGDYIMYRNEKKNVEVHARLWTCFSGVSCNCGVAIREKNDIAVLTVCNDVLLRKSSEVTPITVKLRNKEHKPLADGFYIGKKSKGSEMDYNVLLPSGTRVTVSRRYWGMNVYINAPGTDKGKVKGLCGNFNGKKDDDFIGGDGKLYTDKTLFGDSWHIPHDLSFFESYPVSIPPVDDGISCTCPAQDDINTIKECQETANNYFDVPKYFQSTMRSMLLQRQKKRSTYSQWYSDDIIDQEDRSYFVDDQHAQQVYNRIRNKRSPKQVITHEEATKYCRRQIEESTAGKACKEVTGASIKIAMRQCITDLELTGDTAYALSAFDFMAYHCRDVTIKNISLYTKSPTGDLIPPTKLVEDLCPADCSGHGRCKNEKCICDEGFTALDCSMDVYAVPEVLGIYNGGLCDLRERPCRKTNLMGQNFISSENLSCHVEEIEVFPGPWSPRGVPIKLNGDMFDLYGVKCNLPEPPTKLGDYEHEGTPAGGLLISVSNDGFDSSIQRVRHVSFDSKCLNCTNSSKCELKANSCLIRGHCFAANEPNPRDWCQQCFPGDDQKSWTRRKINQAPNFISETTMFATEGEDLLIQLKAIDPDNRPVIFSVLGSTATGYKLTRFGLLTWKVTSNENKKFTFKVTDECGKFDTIDVTVRIVKCPCLYGGKCVPHPYHPRGSGLYQCKCLEKFSGERCEICKGNVDNKVPKFTTKATIFALQGEDLSIQLKAEEPENLPITYSILSSTATGYTFSPSGLLRWKVTSNQNKKFTFKVTNVCRASDTIDVTVRIVQCPCFNGGKCVPHPDHPRGYGQYQCRCVNRFSGKRCERCPGLVCPARNVTVKAVGSTKLEVKWLGPSDNSVTYYFVKYAMLNYGFRREQVPKTLTTTTLTRLRKFTDYRIAVSVVNRYGEKSVETMAKTGEDIPDAAPVITDVTPLRYDRMKVKWSLIPERKRNGIIRGYKIYYKKQFTEEKWNVSITPRGDMTSAVVTGLKPYTVYCVKMSAFTSKGEYPDWKRKQCNRLKTPSLPIKVSGKAISSTQILLRFEKPKQSASVKRVQVDYGKKENRLNMKKACKASSCFINRLEEDTLYYFRVIGYVYQRGESASFTQIRTLPRDP